MGFLIPAIQFQPGAPCSIEKIHSDLGGSIVQLKKIHFDLSGRIHELLLEIALAIKYFLRPEILEYFRCARYKVLPPSGNTGSFKFGFPAAKEKVNVQL